MINENESSSDSEDHVIGESGSDSDTANADESDVDSIPNDESLSSDDLELMNGSDTEDDVSDDEFEDIPPLRQRISGVSSDRQVSGRGDSAAEGLKSSSGRTWSTRAPVSTVGRSSRANICREGDFRVKADARVETAREVLLLFLGCFIAEAIRYTNLHGRRTVTEWNRKHAKKRHWHPVDEIEMEAFIGLHILAGAFKAQYRSTEELWSERDGPPVFRATMSRERFCALKSALRFDDPLRRDKGDRLAPIRNVFESFVGNIRRLVVAGPHLTVDEQLLEFHGRVHFKQYIPSKPGKFGIKIFWVCDVSTSYCLNGIVYIGKDSVSANFLEKSSSVPESIVLSLCSPFLKGGRNITADNWFTSVALMKRLLDQETTYVGTVRRNSRDVPLLARVTKNRLRGDSKHFYSEGILLCSFWDKGSAPVLLLDSFARVSHDTEPGSKPPTVSFYNDTKSAVDNLDHLIRNFSCKRKCRRWPYSVAMNLVDVAGVNGSIIFRHTHQAGDLSKRDKSHAHLNFLRRAGYELVDAHIQRRLACGPLSKPTSLAIQLLGYQRQEKLPVNSHVMEKYARCAFCPRGMDRKVKVCCTSCTRAMCSDHRAYVCEECS